MLSWSTSTSLLPPRVPPLPCPVSLWASSVISHATKIKAQQHHRHHCHHHPPHGVLPYFDPSVPMGEMVRFGQCIQIWAMWKFRLTWQTRWESWSGPSSPECCMLSSSCAQAAARPRSGCLCSGEDSMLPLNTVLYVVGDLNDRLNYQCPPRDSCWKSASAMNMCPVHRTLLLQLSRFLCTFLLQIISCNKWNYFLLQCKKRNSNQGRSFILRLKKVAIHRPLSVYS